MVDLVDPRAGFPDAVAVRQRRRDRRIDAEILAYADENDALASLRDAEPLCVEQRRDDAVAALLLLQYLEEEALGRSLHQAGDVLRDEHLRHQAVAQPDVVEEKLLVLLAGAVLVDLVGSPSVFALACGREGLAVVYDYPVGDVAVVLFDLEVEDVLLEPRFTDAADFPPRHTEVKECTARSLVERKLVEPALVDRSPFDDRGRRHFVPDNTAGKPKRSGEETEADRQLFVDGGEAANFSATLCLRRRMAVG